MTIHTSPRPHTRRHRRLRTFDVRRCGAMEEGRDVFAATRMNVFDATEITKQLSAVFWLSIPHRGREKLLGSHIGLFSFCPCHEP